MKDFNNEKNVSNSFIALEELTSEYKKVLNSKEYKMGKRVYDYINLLRSGKVITICKRLLRRKKEDYDKIISQKEEKISNFKSYFSNKRIAVYTSVFGSYDRLLDPVIKPDNIDYYIITDQEVDKDSKWKKVDFEDVIPSEIKDGTSKNRYVKMLPHKIFKDYDYSIYVDGNVWITSDLTPLISSLEEFPVAMHRHKNRDCVYDEIDVCIKKGKDSEDSLRNHQKLLEKHNVPRNFGLLEATVIARKHFDEECIDLMESWWKEFKENSKRDQISLIDCIWTKSINIDKIATLGNNTFDNNKFIIFSHK